MVTVPIRRHFVIIITAAHAMNAITAATEWMEPVVHVERDSLSGNIRAMARVAHTYHRTAVIKHVVHMMRMMIAGPDIISMDMSGNARVIMDGRQERLDDRHPYLSRTIRIGSKCMSTSAVLREREARTVIVPVAITRRMMMDALRQNAPVQRIPPEAIAMQERKRKDVPVPMDGLQRIFTTMSLVLMVCFITSIPVAQAEARRMVPAAIFMDLVTKIRAQIMMRIAGPEYSISTGTTNHARVTMDWNRG